MHIIATIETTVLAKCHLSWLICLRNSVYTKLNISHYTVIENSLGDDFNKRKKRKEKKFLALYTITKSLHNRGAVLRAYLNNR